MFQLYDSFCLVFSKTWLARISSFECEGIFMDFMNVLYESL